MVVVVDQTGSQSSFLRRSRRLFGWRFGGVRVGHC